MVLSEYGAMVKTAATGAETIALLTSYQPDVVILDIGLPDIDGYRLLQLIHHQRNTLEALDAASDRASELKMIPAIALTAYVQEADKQATFNAGFQVHLAKPVDIYQLVQTVVDLTNPK